MTRHFWVLLHRYAGLAITVFLIMAGLTGTLLAFNSELERVFAPQLFALPPTPDAKPLDLSALAIRAEILVPHARVERITLTETDQAMVGFIPEKNPETGKPYDLGFTQFFIDPWTGQELGRRNRGNLSEGIINLMPFIYDLHWRLALGNFGQWTMGIAALVWTLDCFNGFYLTLPISTAGFWRRWKAAWLIKRKASTYRLNFDLHRATSLWLWAMLFVFAWSSVMMNMRAPIYDWVTKIVFDYQSPLDEYKLMQKRITENKQATKDKPHLDWRAAQSTGERLITEQSIKHNFTAGQPLGLSYNPKFGTYSYEIRGSRDIFERAPKGGSTTVTFDGDAGTFVKLHQPTGEHAGNTVDSWLYALHMARVFGRPYQIFVCVLGLLIVMLSVTGVYIWLKKRNARKFSQEKHARLTV